MCRFFDLRKLYRGVVDAGLILLRAGNEECLFVRRETLGGHDVVWQVTKHDDTP